MLLNLVISAISAGIAEVITLPICTIKTNYQNTKSDSLLTTTRSIYQSSGLKGFYRASLPAIGGQALSTSSKYMLYRYFGSFSQNKMINGALSGIISSLVTHPLDTVKIHRQMNSRLYVKFRRYCLHNDFPRRIIKLFYRGYSKSFTKVLVSSSLFFPLYDTVREMTENPFKAAVISSVVSTTIMHPIDYLKTRHIYGLKLFMGWNPRNYFKGLHINLLRIVPHFIITMSLIDLLSLNLSK